jgi:hypothetical protein
VRAIVWIRLSPSSGGRQPSKTWRRRAGRASRKSTLWCARDTSPGIGTWPPPISPTSEMVWWGCAKWAGRHQRRAVAGEAGDAVDARGLDGFSQDHRRQDGGEPPGQHRLARPRWPSMRRLWSERLHSIYLCLGILESGRLQRATWRGNVVNYTGFTCALLPLDYCMAIIDLL